MRETIRDIDRLRHDSRGDRYLGHNSRHTQVPVPATIAVKSVQNEKYSAKNDDFLRFYAYLCHVIDDFACLDLQH